MPQNEEGDGASAPSAGATQPPQRPVGGLAPPGAPPSSVTAVTPVAAAARTAAVTPIARRRVGGHRCGVLWPIAGIRRRRRLRHRRRLLLLLLQLLLLLLLRLRLGLRLEGLLLKLLMLLLNCYLMHLERRALMELWVHVWNGLWLEKYLLIWVRYLAK